ncbi:TadG family pilus assembly protein [Comamonas sp. lk]|uniref:TadG family pilus assembly protein n=1 Tax=Comamonas sp. lk TaxID=2201272 RepID=UPI000EB349A1|nr:TadG family pilus assembly protein [Comamonas sp. lk]
MRLHSPDLSDARTRRQSGSVAMLGALWLMVAVICLATIDIGNVFWQKRELQKIADLAALAGAQAETAGDCQVNAKRIATLNGMAGTPLVECGNWAPVAGAMDSKSFFVSGATPMNASRVTASRNVPYFFVFSAGASNSRDVQAMATAARSRPLVQLRVRSKLIEVDDKKSAILNPIIGGLLGGSLNVSAVGWNGLANVQLSLLDFFRELGMKKGLIDVNAAVIDYEKILDTNISALDVIEVMLSALQKQTNSNNTPQAVSAAITALGAIASANISKVQLKLRDLLDIKSGTSDAALMAQLNALNIVQLLAQVSGQKSGVVVNSDVLGGVVRISLKVIEPPQSSVIAPLPSMSATSFENAAIAVKTAQIQALISADLKVLDGLSGLVNFLLGLVGFLTSVSPQLTEIPTRFDLHIEGVGGQAWVESGQCSPTKQMKVHAETSIAKIRFGRMGNSADEALANAYSKNPSNYLQPFKIVDIGRQPILLGGLLGIREAGYYGGVGLKIDTASALKNSKILNLSAPDTLLPLNSTKEAFQNFSMMGIIASLQSLLSSDALQVIQPPTGRNSPTGLAGLANNILAEVLKLLSTIVGKILAPLLDPVLDQLLGLLGIDVAQAQVEGRMDCGAVELVY